MLQSKPVRKSESDQMREGITDIKERIKLIQDRASLLSGIFANMCRSVLESGCGNSSAERETSRFSFLVLFLKPPNCHKDVRQSLELLLFWDWPGLLSHNALLTLNQCRSQTNFEDDFYLSLIYTEHFLVQ